MFIFGHIGIGKKIASPWRRALPAFPLVLGMLLPDIIDKSLYYGRSDFPINLVTCTRTFGHTGIFLASTLLLAVGLRGKSAGRWLAALSFGIATHLLLDCLIDLFHPEAPSPAWIALTWPFLHHRFATYYFPDIESHLRKLAENGPTVAAEIIGIGLLVRDHFKKAEISRKPKSAQ